MGELMFPAMLLGPVISGIVLTVMLDGRAGLQDLFRRITGVHVSVRWYATLLLPPALVLGVLLVLEKFISPVFAPNHFYLGIAFGVPAGICEEIGWMGFAFPKMRTRLSPLLAAIILGLLWGLWHLPAIDFLGASVPHGKYWLRFFFAFTIAMTAMRVIIAWLYVNTGSVWLAQLMHVSSTGALVVFSPRVGPGEEVMWYFAYGCLLWLLVTIIVSLTGRQLQVSERQNIPSGPSGDTG
jgi:membrane protease YdiL (CAAX protease family)